MGFGLALVFLALIVAGIRLAAVLVGVPRPRRRPGRWLEILRERCARGEITRVQFEELRRDLRR